MKKNPNAPVAPMTEDEIQTLRNSSTEQEWNKALQAILDRRDGNYPPRWVEIAGPLMQKFA